MTKDPNDAFAQAKQDEKPTDVQMIVELAEEVADVERSVEELEGALKEAKKRLNLLKTKRIPEEMARIEMEEFKLPSGIRIKITDFVSGSLPKEEDKRIAAIDWLDANEGGGLIKTELSVFFNRDFREEALKVENELAEAGWAPELKENVHPQTLQAFARERLKNGEDVPFDLLGLYSGRIAKITIPKE